jgi:hypothetical protein
MTDNLGVSMIAHVWSISTVRTLVLIFTALLFSSQLALAQFTLGPKLVGTGAVGNPDQGYSLALSADGNTAIVGGPGDNGVGAAWVYARSNRVWTQQGDKLVGTGAVVGSMAPSGAPPSRCPPTAAQPLLAIQPITQTALAMASGGMGLCSVGDPVIASCPHHRHGRLRQSRWPVHSTLSISGQRDRRQHQLFNFGVPEVAEPVLDLRHSIYHYDN